MKILITLLLLICSSAGIAQDSADNNNPTKSIDGIVNKVLAIITGDKGENRDWEAFRNLFTGDAQISVLNHTEGGKMNTRTYTLEEFVRIGRQYYENNGFIEYEIKKIVNEYNGIANVFQSYYAKESDVEEKGINSYQLIYDGTRWWIKSILWSSNRNGKELPLELRE